MKFIRQIHIFAILFALMAIIGTGACGESDSLGGTGSGSGSDSGTGGSGGSGGSDYTIKYQKEILTVLLKESDYYINSFSALNNCSEYSSVVSKYENQIKLDCSGGGYKTYSPRAFYNPTLCDSEILLRYQPIDMRIDYYDCKDSELGLTINGPFEIWPTDESATMDFGELLTSIQIIGALPSEEEVQAQNLDHLQLHINDQIPQPSFKVVKANGKNQCAQGLADGNLSFYTPTWVYDCLVTPDCSTCKPQ